MGAAQQRVPPRKAVREGEQPVLVVCELKLRFNLELVLQGVERASVADGEKPVAAWRQADDPVNHRQASNGGELPKAAGPTPMARGECRGQRQGQGGRQAVPPALPPARLRPARRLPGRQGGGDRQPRLALPARRQEAPLAALRGMAEAARRPGRRRLDPHANHDRLPAG